MPDTFGGVSLSNPFVTANTSQYVNAPNAANIDNQGKPIDWSVYGPNGPQWTPNDPGSMPGGVQQSAGLGNPLNRGAVNVTNGGGLPGSSPAATNNGGTNPVARPGTIDLSNILGNPANGTPNTVPYVSAAGTQATQGMQTVAPTNPLSRPGGLTYGTANPTNPLARGSVNVQGPTLPTINNPTSTVPSTLTNPLIGNPNQPTTDPTTGTRSNQKDLSVQNPTNATTQPNTNPAVPADWQHFTGVLPSVYGSTGMSVQSMATNGQYNTDPNTNPGASLPDWLKNQFHYVQQNSGGDGGQSFGAWQFGDGNGTITDQNGNSVVQVGDPRKLLNTPVNGGQWLKDPTAVHYDAFLGYVTSPNNIGSSLPSERGFYAFGAALLGGGLLAAGGVGAGGVGDSGAFDMGGTTGFGGTTPLDGAVTPGAGAGVGTGGSTGSGLLDTGPTLPNVTAPTIPDSVAPPPTITDPGPMPPVTSTPFNPVSPTPTVPGAAPPLIPGVTNNPLINNPVTRGLGTSLLRNAIMPTSTTPNYNVNTNGNPTATNPSGSPTGNNGTIFNPDGSVNLGNILSTGTQLYSNNQDIQGYNSYVNGLISQGDPNAANRPGQLSTVNQLVTDPASAINNDPAYQAYRNQSLGNESRLLAARGFNMSGNEEGDLNAQSKNLDETYIHQRLTDAISASSNMNPQPLLAQAIHNSPLMFQALANRNGAAANAVNSLIKGLSPAIQTEATQWLNQISQNGGKWVDPPDDVANELQAAADKNGENVQQYVNSVMNGNNPDSYVNMMANTPINISDPSTITTDNPMPWDDFFGP